MEHHVNANRPPRLPLDELERKRLDRQKISRSPRPSSAKLIPFASPHLLFTPEEDRGAHPVMASISMSPSRDNLLSPLSPRRVRPTTVSPSTVLFSVLPSHLEKAMNNSLRPSLRIWRPEQEDNVSRLLALVPFFNETPEELYKTLQSMLKTHAYLLSPKKAGYMSRIHQGQCNLHVLIIQDGYKKACTKMNEWLRETFPCKAWDYLAKLQNTQNGAAVEDKETVGWLCKRTQRLFGRSRGPGRNRNFYQTRECSCCGHRNPIEADVFCEGCGLHLSSDPLKEAAIIFQIVNAERKVVPFVLTHPENPNESVMITLSLIVKCRNRQKHDSHWWGLSRDNGFMKAYSAHAIYGWLTDCGTLFHYNTSLTVYYRCLYHLMVALNQEDVAAVTGRQRVMSPSHQDGENEGFMSRFLRHVQRCDFELNFGAQMGSFAAFGFLPVLPGPCGFYKISYLLECAPFYHDFLSMEVEDIGVIDANLMIAEDRVLSWAPFFESVIIDQSEIETRDPCVVIDSCCWDDKESALDDGVDDKIVLTQSNSGKKKAGSESSSRVDESAKRVTIVTPRSRAQVPSDLTVGAAVGVINQNVRTALAPEAIFYFEAETVMQSFVKQRRRWLNGTFCGYLWLLYKRPFYPTSSKSVPSIEGPVLLKKKEDAEEKSKEKENCKKQAMDGAKVESCKDDSSPELSSGTDDEAESLEYIYSSSSEEEKSEEDYKEEKGKDTEIPIIEDIPPAGNPLKITIPRLSHSNQQRFSNTPRSRDGSSRPGSGRSSSRSSSHRKSSKSDLLKSSRGGNYSARSNSSRDPKSARVGDYDDREGDAIRYQWRIPWYRLVPINILLFIQLWMNLWVYLGPAIFVSMFRYSLKILSFSPSILSTYWWIAILILYVLFVWISTKNTFYSWLFYVATIFGMIIEILSIAGIGMSTYDYFYARSHSNSTNTTITDDTMFLNGTLALTNTTDDVPDNFKDAPLWLIVTPLVMVGLIMILPVFASCLACPKLFTNFFRSSFWYILISGLPYFLFLPTLVAVFGSFSLARLFDFTWGNRDSSGSVDKLGSRLDELQQRAKFASPFFVLCNIMLVFLLADLTEISPVALLCLSVLLFGPVLIHFGLSFLYFLWWRLTRHCRRPARKLI